MFYQGVPIDHCTHVTGSVDKYSSESKYNAEFTAGMDLSHFRMLNNELSNKDPYVVPEQAPLIILDIKSDVCTDKNGKDNKPTRKIPRRMHYVRRNEEINLYKTLWCEGGLQLTDIGTKNVREDELNHILGYDMERLYN